MENKPWTWGVPQGVKDLLPADAREKRLLEGRLSQVFERWGYDEVVTPSFEHYESLTAGGVVEGEQLFKFIDRHGKILALRPDMTTPIARLVATRLQHLPLPLRLFYLANVFRYENPQTGRQREFYQAGVELLGAASPRADAEVIALAVEALRATGLQEFQVGIGQVEIVQGMLEHLSLPGEVSAEVREALLRKDLVGVEGILEKYRVSSRESRQVTRLFSLHGGQETLDEAVKLTAPLENSSRARQAVDNLREVYEMLKAYEVADKVFIDLGIQRDFDYYTGIVFEGYALGIGFPVCGGGRYDKLLGSFGYPCPATGFAIGIERVLLALGGTGTENKKAAGYLICGTDYRLSLGKARQLRNDGYRVEVDILEMEPEEATEYAQQKGIAKVLVGEE
ncbi:MAG: ATP phosphoribosyltransferase regulatory subunit [Bacillota bacterium]